MALFQDFQASLDDLIHQNQARIENGQALSFSIVTSDTCDYASSWIAVFHQVVGTMAEKQCIAIQQRHIFWVDSAEWLRRWLEFCEWNDAPCETTGSDVDPVVWAEFLDYYKMPLFPLGQFLSVQAIEYTFLVDLEKYQLARI